MPIVFSNNSNDSHRKSTHVVLAQERQTDCQGAQSKIPEMFKYHENLENKCTISNHRGKNCYSLNNLGQPASHFREKSHFIN